MKFKYQDHANNSGIYKILNTHTNRVYIGQARTFKKRWYDYSNHLPKNKGHNKFLLNDFKKCFEELGHTDFLEFHVLEAMPSSTKEQRKEREEYWIAQFYDGQKECYNFRKTVDRERSCWSSTPEETRKRISLSNKGRIVWNKGIPATESHKGKLSESHKGKTLSNKTKLKMRCPIWVIKHHGLERNFQVSIKTNCLWLIRDKFHGTKARKLTLCQQSIRRKLLTQ